MADTYNNQTNLLNTSSPLKTEATVPFKMLAANLPNTIAQQR